MKKLLYNIGILAVATSAIVACNLTEMETPSIPSAGTGPLNISSEIQASAQVEGSSTTKVATKSLVDRITTRELNCQFLRIDEDTDDYGKGLYTFKDNDQSLTCDVNYERAYIVQAKAISSPDNTQWNLRSITFTPQQSYKLRIKATEDGKKDTTQFYHTRMVGWYPRDVDKFPDDRDVFERLENEPDLYDKTEDGRVRIKISNLTAEDDVMVTDLKEGQHWHRDNGTYGPAGNRVEYSHYSNTDKDGNNIYTVPFGYNKEHPSYLNYFKFKHYRSAIRVYATAEQSRQNLAMWGRITGVTLANQPTSCKITLPQQVTKRSTFTLDANGDVENSSDATSIFTNNNDVEWGDRKSVSIITTPMFGNDTNHSDELQKTVDFSTLTLEGAEDKASRVYLGYALIEPNHDVTVELHTTSGVYSVEIPWQYNLDGVTKNLFDPSFYYTVTLSLQTSGTIAEILELDSDEHYYDLTALRTLDDAEKIYGYGYSNCYIVDPSSSDVTTALNALRTTLGDDNVEYDGYAFCAVKAGNGPTGLADPSWYPGTTDIQPASARLIWESTKGLVSSVELVHNYVRFKVKKPWTEGNAVVGVYDSKGVLLWSWHLWLTDTPKDVKLGSYTFMDRNLGATAALSSISSATADNALESYGLYYQWGRKDPSMGPRSYNYSIYSLISSNYWDYASDEYNAAQIKQKDQITLEDGVKNPMYLLLPSSQTQNYYFNWLYKDDRELWGYDYATKNTNKTIYDPCPFGYRVPANELENAVENADTKENGTYGHRYKYDGGEYLYMPYAGFKGDDRGSNSVVLTWNHVGKVGDYQTSMTSSDTDDYYHHRGRVFISNWSSNSDWKYDRGSDKNYYENYRVYDYTNRRTAASLRCVKETSAFGSITASFELESTVAKNEEYLVADDVLNLNYDVTSVNSVITHIAIDLQYNTSDGKAVKSNIFEKSSNLGVKQHGTVKFTVQDQEFLNAVASGGYTFVLTAKNDLNNTVNEQVSISNTFFNAQLKSMNLTGTRPDGITRDEPAVKEKFGLTLEAKTSQGATIKAVKIYDDTTLLTTIDGNDGSSITTVSGSPNNTVTATTKSTALSFAEGGVYSLHAEFVFNDNSTTAYPFKVYVWGTKTNFKGTALAGTSWTANGSSSKLYYLLYNKAAGGYLRSITTIPAPEGSVNASSSGWGSYTLTTTFTLTNYNSSYEYYYGTEDSTSGLTKATVSNNKITFTDPVQSSGWNISYSKTYYIFAYNTATEKYGISTKIVTSLSGNFFNSSASASATPKASLQVINDKNFDENNPKEEFFFKLESSSSPSKIYSVGLGAYIGNNGTAISYNSTGSNLVETLSQGNGYLISYSNNGSYYLYINSNSLAASQSESSAYWSIIPYYYGECYVDPDPNR